MWLLFGPENAVSAANDAICSLPGAQTAVDIFQRACELPSISEQLASDDLLDVRAFSTACL